MARRAEAVVLIAVLVSVVFAACDDSITLRAPRAPQGLTVSGARVSSLVVGWDADDVATHYTVYRDTNETGAFGMIVYRGADTSFTDTSLTAGTEYFYRATAGNSAGVSGLSSVAGGTTVPVPLQGLVAEFLFNGDGADSSGNENNASVHDAELAANRHSFPESAYQFDGTASYLEVANSDELNPENAVTVSAWIYLSDYPDGENWMSIVNKRESYVGTTLQDPSTHPTRPATCT